MDFIPCSQMYIGVRALWPGKGRARQWLAVVGLYLLQDRVHAVQNPLLILF